MMGETGETGETYVERTARILGDRDPVDVLRATPAAVDAVVAGHPIEVLRARPRPGCWTPVEIIGHLGDAEWVFGYRLRMILWEGEPDLPGFDQDRWVAAQGHADADPAALAARFAALRAASLPLWAGLTAADLARAGRVGRRGRETLEAMRRVTAGHDLLHLDQIARYVAAAEVG